MKQVIFLLTLVSLSASAQFVGGRRSKPVDEGVVARATQFVTGAQLRAGVADTVKAVFLTDEGRSGVFVYQPGATDSDDSSMVIISSGRRYKRQFDGPILLEWFGAKGDYNYSTESGSDDTGPIRKAVNFAATKGYEIRLMAGKKYLTGTIYAYKDSTYNLAYPAKPGRIKITGGASGIATGSLEPQGSAFVHKNGIAAPLFACKGTFSIQSAGSTGGFLDIQNVNFVGGNQTTDVMYLQLTVGQVSFKNFTVQINNPAGNGITENNTWESTMENILIRGQAAGTGSWTGIGLNLISDESGGQINMKTYNNVDTYKCGYGIRIGRRNGNPLGTFSPLVFISGQCSLSDQYNMWLGAGVYNLVSIGQQFEGSRLSAIYINSTGETDVTRNVKFINSYFTGGGRIEDGSNDSYAIQNTDGVNIEFDSPLFNNLGNGIVYDMSVCDGFVIRRPYIRTVRTYGTTSGTYLNGYGTQGSNIRIQHTNPTFNANPATIMNTGAQTHISRTNTGGFLSFANNQATISIALSGGVNQSAQLVNFNNSSATVIGTINGGVLYQELKLVFANTLTTIDSNSTIFLKDGVDYVPTNRSCLTLMWMGTYWIEISRS